MNYSQTDMQSVVDPSYNATAPNQPQEPLQFTPEELKVLRECSKEGIYQRAIPMGIIFGIGGLFGAKAGPLNTARYGAKPAIVGLGILGYFIGRFSYSKVCIQRLLEVPDGNFRKMFPQRPNIQSEPPQSDFYVAVEPPPKPQDSAWKAQSTSTDIDVASTSSFDTIPSEYYDRSSDQPLPDLPPVQNYTSYDDLRRQNRDEYSSRFRPQQTSQPRYPVQPPQERPPVRRPDLQEPINLGKQTKYGDAWE